MKGSSNTTLDKPKLRLSVTRLLLQDLEVEGSHPGYLWKVKSSWETVNPNFRCPEYTAPQHHNNSNVQYVSQSTLSRLDRGQAPF